MAIRFPKEKETDSHASDIGHWLGMTNCYVSALFHKHGISFETAALVFADKERIGYYDKLHSLDEDRYVVLGCVQGILYVVYTMRDEAARLIYARLATPTERKIYYGE